MQPREKAKIRLLEPIKEAIMMEIHGLRFYQVAAERCTNNAARELFQDLAHDELKHRSELEKQFRAILREGKWSPPPSSQPHDLRFRDPVIDRSFKQDIEGIWFDSAALQIGIMLERRALEHYRDKQQSTRDPDARALFQWLIQWEAGHLERLMAMERSMREEIWNEARFWPLD